MKTQEVIAELVKNDRIDALFEPTRSNLLYTETEQNIAQNPFLRLLGEPIDIAGLSVKYAAQEPLSMAAGFSDMDAPSTSIQKGGFKEGETSAVYIAEDCALSASEMALYKQFKDSSNSTRRSLASRIAPSFSNAFKILAKRLLTAKTLMVTTALRGSMVAGGVSIPNDIQDTDYSAGGLNQPWNTTSSDIPKHFQAAQESTKYSQVNTVFMNQHTWEEVYQNDFVQGALSEAALEVGLLFPTSRAVGSIHGIEIVVVSFLENEYQLADKTYAKFIEDGEAFFINRNAKVFGHYNFWNFNETEEVTGNQSVDNTTFGSQATVARTSNPPKIEFVHTVSFGVDVQVPGGALYVKGY